MAEPATPASLPTAPAAAPLQEIDRVGSELRRVFDDVVADPLPQAFEDLLKQLR